MVDILNHRAENVRLEPGQLVAQSDDGTVAVITYFHKIFPISSKISFNLIIYH